MRALRRAAAALPALSRRSRSRRRGRASELTLSDSRLGLRGWAASRCSFPAFAGLRSVSARALAGAFLLLALGVLAAPVAQAQTPELTGFSVTAVAGSTDKLNVRWGTVAGAANYIVQWKTKSQSYHTDRAKQVGGGATGTQITGLTANTEYDVKVNALSSTNVTLARSEVTATTNAPAVPNLAVTPVSGSTDKLEVSWNVVPGATDYDIEWKTGSELYTLSRARSVLQGEEKKIRITGLIAGTTYGIRATAYASNRVIARSETTATTNAPPRLAPLPGLTARPISGSGDKLNVSWNAPPGIPVNSYNIRWKTGNQDYASTRQLTVTSSESPLPTSAQITGLTANTTYDVQVTGLNSSNVNLARSETSATTNQAQNVIRLTLSETSIDEGASGEFYKGTVTLVGGARSTATTVTTSAEYETADFNDISSWVVHKTFTIPSGRSSASFTWGVTPHDDRIRENSETFRIVATATVGGADHTDSVAVTIVDNDLPRLTGLTVAPVSGTNDQLRISWNAVPGANDYVLQWKSGDQEYITRGRRSAIGNLTSTPHTGRTPGTRYTYRVTAVNTTTEPNTELAQAEASGSTHWVAPPPTATIAADSSPVTEGTAAAFTVTLSHALSIAVSVNYQVGWSRAGRVWDAENQRWVEQGSYKDPSDTSTHSPVSVEIAANATTATVSVPTHDDATDEADGYVTVLLTSGGHYRLPKKPTTEDWARVVVTDNDGTADAPPGDDEAPEGVGAPPLTGLSVASVAGKPTELAVTWDPVEGATTYLVRWKTGSGDYGDAVEASTNSHTVTGLSASTTYTVNVAAVDTDYTLLAEGTASGATAAPGTGAATQFTVYHESNGASAAAGRYDTAVGLLNAASVSYAVRTVTGTGEVDRLAGVSNSVLPRFFLGDPTAEGWTSEPGINNGGLKWLRSVLEELPEQSPPPAPSVSIAAGAAVTEGTAASFTVTLSAAAPAAGLTLAYGVSEDGAFVAAADEGAKTLSVSAGATSATLSVPTAGDGNDEPDGKVTVTLADGTGYTVGSPASASVTVRDDDEPAAAPAAAFTVYHDPNHGAAAVRRYQTAVGLLKAAGRSYTLRTVSGTGTVDGLAGTTNSVMPRFFLGDPTDSGWTSQPGTNNGGLRWLRSKLAALPPPAPAVPALSVADASAQESSGSISFAVTLSAAASESVSVDWATSNGTAVAGSDYTAASGTLTFAAGETGKTVTVALLDDVHDEGTETFTLTLSNPRPAGKATIADATATGSISNADPLQKDWLARFGRAAASDAVAAITARFETPRDAGSHLTVGGHRLSFDGAGAGAGLPPAPVHGPAGASWPSWSGDPAGGGEGTMSGRELLLGTSFRAVLGSGAGVQWTGWGQGASVSQFSSSGSGLSLSGETATGSLGMDYERGPLLAGFAMTHSLGEGEAHGAGRSYAMGSAVTTMLPYARFALSERVSAWGLAGTGTGRLTLDLDGGASERYGTDLSMMLAAAGLRGELLTPDEAGGFALAVKADALWVRTDSESVSAPGVGRLAGARADASRLRAVLDGSRTFALSGGRTLSPSVELGLRHDGGDAETGTGFELGAGLGYADPSRGLDMALRVHGLAAHAEEGYSEWSVSGSLRLQPGGSGRGLSLSLVPTWGNAASDAERLWSARDAGELGLAEDFEAQARLEGELGYGLALRGVPGVVTPFAGFTTAGATSRSYRTGARWRIAPDATLTLEAARSEGAAGEPPEHRFGLGAQFRW